MAGFGRLFSPIKLDHVLNGRNKLCQCDIRWYTPVDRSIKKQITQILPPKPKRPPSPFLRFLLHGRAKWLKEDPSLNATQIACKAGKEWAKAEPMLKKSLSEKFHTELAEYKQNLAVYYKSITNDQMVQYMELKGKLNLANKKIAIEKKCEILGKPKRPIGLFVRYMKMMSHRRGDRDLITWVQQLAKEWKELPYETKQPLIDENTRDRERYKMEMKEWESKMIRDGFSDLVSKKRMVQKD